VIDGPSRAGRPTREPGPDRPRGRRAPRYRALLPAALGLSRDVARLDLGVGSRGSVLGEHPTRGPSGLIVLPFRTGRRRPVPRRTDGPAGGGPVDRPSPGRTAPSRRRAGNGRPGSGNSRNRRRDTTAVGRPAPRVPPRRTRGERAAPEDTSGTRRRTSAGGAVRVR